MSKLMKEKTKKIDERIRTLIENGVKTNHRSIFVIIGDESTQQIANLHYILSKAVVKSRPTVLWCYKGKLDFSSHVEKCRKQLKDKIKSGKIDRVAADSFSLFLESGVLQYCSYRDSERILGSTHGMCVLQDFEALTPNLLARTIETVEGGGLVVLLLRSLSSLTSLYTMVMDVHERYRTESHYQATGRFNERFMLSLASCKACVVMDDDWNILPISSHIRSISPVSLKEDSNGLSESQSDLKSLKDQLCDDFPAGPLIKMCSTLDQGKAVITFLDAILDKTLRSTIALTAARGRGKSAALGLAIAGAIAAGYSNIYVTAPTPDNLRTLFDFVLKGFNSLKFKENTDYDIKVSEKVIIKVNVYKQHRQTIQYIQPHECAKLSQVELLVIDEAAAIPLPIVKSLLGPYLVFLSSTINGYEGTGRSLSLKLIQQLDEQSRGVSKNVDAPLSGRLFKKVELNESIRYAPGDPVESWLNGLLCLDVTNSIPNISRLPPPKDCDLYYVNRDTLFSYHKESELFLQRMMALYVSSHYKNSPNDLQLMSDAPAHHLFVLLGPVNESKNHLPDILCVIQVCLEGQISKKSAMKSLSQGHQPSGDQIPWKFCEQFKDTEFPTLSGARIVRIATHPSAMRLGYGSVAVELLTRYYEGQLTSISEAESERDSEKSLDRMKELAEKISLLKEQIKPRANLPHLLVHLRERRPEKLHYLGVSFGLTLDLFRFWRKHSFGPFYICHVPSAVTGEHTCMVLKALHNDDIKIDESDEWGFFGPFYREYKQRFSRLLHNEFRNMEYKLAMSILDPKINFMEQKIVVSLANEYLSSLGSIMTPYDFQRLESYVNNLADYHSISDLVFDLGREYFRGRFPVTLSYVQASVLLCMGLQGQDVSFVEKQMKLERSQILSLFIKVMKKLYNYLNSVASKEIESTLPRIIPNDMKPHRISLDEDLNAGAKKIKAEMKAKSEEGLDLDELQKYKIVDKDAEFEEALQNGGKISASGLISVKSITEKQGKHKDCKESGKKRNKDHQGSGSNQKKKK